MRKLIAFDDDTLDKLTQLARDRMGTFQELADEAFAELLEQPTSWPKRRAPEKRGPQRHRASPAAGQKEGARKVLGDVGTSGIAS